MEDYERHPERYGDHSLWPDDFVIIDCPEIPIEEAEQYSQPKIIETPGTDPDIGEATVNQTLVHVHAGSMDYASLERRSPPRDTLNTIRKITREAIAVRAALSFKDG